MLRSMTGFGSAAGHINGVEYAVEVRSVNNRYFKSSIKLPEALWGTETEVEQHIRQHVRRGTVTMSLQMRLPDERAASCINTTVLSSYLDQLRPIGVEANPMLRIDLATLLGMPGVCEPPSVEELLESTRQGMFDVIEQALAALVAMRTKEGSALRDDLLGQCAAVQEHLAVVQQAAPRIVLDYQERLTQRITDLLRAGKVAIDQDQLAREVAVFADRSDVAEEISRLTHHVEQFRQTVEKAGPTGRKLDFIAQEMLREANTIASKANSSAVAAAVVEIKTAIDRIKEQVQNVE